MTAAAHRPPLAHALAAWLRRLLAVLLAPLVVAGCAGTGTWAPMEAVEAARYAHPGAPEIALITVVNNRTGSGDHTGLVVSGSERVLFDPAGRWEHPDAPERGDVHFGMTPRMLRSYINMHARETHHVIVQRIAVSPEVAALALRRVQDAGPVASAFCARATGEVLRGLPGFEAIPVQWYPITLSRAFGALDGVETHVIRHDDDDVVARMDRAQAPL